MSAKKMLVVTLAKTKGVLAGVTQSGAAVPPVADLVGPGLLIRKRDSELGVVVPVEELEVSEVDFNDEVFRQPLVHIGGDTATVPGQLILTVAVGSGKVTVTVQSASPVPDARAVLVVIDAGPNQDPVRLTGRTAAGVATIDFSISGITGTHLVLASVEGYASKAEVGSF